jgi:hypothetical protein
LGIPERVTQGWLAAAGFTSSNDRTLVAVLRQVQFVDESDVPTDLWGRYRAGDASALAEGIRQGYAGVYNFYADAHARSADELLNVFKSVAPKLSHETVQKSLQTFRSVVTLADFSGDIQDGHFRVLPLGPGDNEVQDFQGIGGNGAKLAFSQARSRNRGSVPTLGMNLHINLPASEDPSVYRLIFGELRRFLNIEGNEGAVEEERIAF